MEQQNYEQRGYLHEDFRLFHLEEAMTAPVDWHYHTFHKIIAFLSGSASYGIEGKSYVLEAGGPHSGPERLHPQAGDRARRAV